MPFLIFQIQMLRSRVHTLKITPTAAEHVELMRFGPDWDMMYRGSCWWSSREPSADDVSQRRPVQVHDDR